MNNIISKFFCAALLLSVPGSGFAKNNFPKTQESLYFIENKGQITDQHLAPRNDIQYAIQAPGINIFIGNGQLHYQFFKTKLKYPDLPGRLLKDFNAHRENNILNEPTATVETYRMDVELTGANPNAVPMPSEKLGYYENYYLQGCPEEGLHANTFSRIMYKNIYNGIDWVIYIKNGKLEHEFVVGPGGKASDIKIKYSGQTSIKINNDGSISATTPMGVVKENAPICYGTGGNNIPSSFKLDGNVLSYNVSTSGNVVIDPVLQWATYYGPDSNTTSFYGSACDAFANIYAGGLTWSETTGNVATSGTHQTTYGGGCDGFLVKFDSSGNRLWGTYYGGPGSDWGNGLAYDDIGSVYVVGTTSSPSGIATTGAPQTTWGGTTDAYLGRFNSAGIRIWGTYAGGTAQEFPQGVICDPVGHVYISGAADSYTGIATPGSHMPVHASGHDDFIIQYDSSGAKRWGSYYGGNGDDFGGTVAADITGVYLAGYTNSTTGIATSSGFRPAIAGPTDAYIVKFTFGGARMWGSYYGGEGAEITGAVTTSFGNLYLCGDANSDTGIATPGCYQAARGGRQDAFLLNINPDLSTVYWGTYFGGPDDETTDVTELCGNGTGDIFITGLTKSTTGISSPTGSWQPTYGGGDNDGFYAKFSPTGSLYWSTYYGGSGEDEGRTCAFDGKNSYLCGQTNSVDQVATPGSFMDTGGGHAFYFHGFIAKFIITDTPVATLNTGIVPLSQNNITLFPNPNKGTFTVSGSGLDNGSAGIMVLDIAGRIVMKTEADVTDGKLNKQITLSDHAAPGIYFIRVLSNGKTSEVRFVKER